jgi:transposase
MRRSFDSLAELARHVIWEEPLSGHLFVFVNRHANRVKILYWDRGGYVLWYKRLEAGRLHLPAATGNRVELEASELALLLEGIDLSGARRSRRFVPRGARA